MSAEITRRSALASIGLWAAGSPLLQSQQQPEPLLQGEPPGRIAPRTELVNTLEFESMAQRKLGAASYAAIAGGDRKAFERMIFRPRMFVNTSQLDMSLELFGDKMIAPILVGPASEQARFHPDAELATVRGASAALAGVVISDRSSQPIGKIAAEAKTPLWYQIYPQRDMAAVLARAQQAVKAGCKVVCLTVGTPYLPSTNPRMDWSVVDQFRKATTVPLVLKGIMSVDEAKTAVCQGRTRDHRVEPRRDFRAGHGGPYRNADVDRGRGWRPDSGHDRWRIPPRQRYREGSGARRTGCLCNASGPVGFGGLRSRWRTGSHRDAAKRDSAHHGGMRKAESRGARPRSGPFR